MNQGMISRIAKKVISSAAEIESKVKDFLMDKYYPNTYPEEVIEDFATDMLKDMLKRMILFKKEVLSAKRRISDWNGSNLETGIYSIYHSAGNSWGMGWEVETLVGSASMTHFEKGRVADVLEDHQDFSSESEMEDYQNLVSEIQDPSSTKRENILTLYTAQPSGFDRKKEIPKGLFLTSDYRDAVGLAMDRDRKVFLVELPANAVVKTKSGRIEWYQVKKKTKGFIERT
tara:strand:- start:1158 stop:1847 length:690 start_codon:yes stop_codon:yes gene_type:complete